jgi:hypothetical protein
LTTGSVVNKPYYVLIDSNKVTELLSALGTTGVGTDLRARVRGTGVTTDPGSVSIFGAFNTDYLTRYGENPRVSGMGPSYDAMYSIAYALAATTDDRPTGASVARGLGLLGSGPTVEVGQTGILPAYQQLTQGKSITGLGTFGKLQWDTKGDVVGGTIEMWCIGLANTTPYFGSAGLTLDVATQALNGAFSPCSP